MLESTLSIISDFSRTRVDVVAKQDSSMATYFDILIDSTMVRTAWRFHVGTMDDQMMSNCPLRPTYKVHFWFYQIGVVKNYLHVGNSSQQLLGSHHILRTIDDSPATGKTHLHACIGRCCLIALRCRKVARKAEIYLGEMKMFPNILLSPQFGRYIFQSISLNKYNLSSFDRSDLI